MAHRGRQQRQAGVDGRLEGGAEETGASWGRRGQCAQAVDEVLSLLSLLSLLCRGA